MHNSYIPTSMQSVKALLEHTFFVRPIETESFCDLGITNFQLFFVKDHYNIHIHCALFILLFYNLLTNKCEPFRIGIWYNFHTTLSHIN